MAITQETRIGEIREWLGTGSINIFGVPCAGKDTQGDRLAHVLGATKLGGGEILRADDLPERVRKIQDAGGLIPLPDFVSAVVPHLSRPDLTGPLVLSAVGRALGEEQGVIEATNRAGHPIRVVPFLEVPAEVAFSRMEAANRGRADDTPEAMMTRFDEFQNKTLGVIDVYDRLGLLVTIDAVADEASVFDATVRAIHEFAQSN